MKKVLCLAVAIGHVKMTDDGLQHPPSCQFLGVLAQEKLAELPGSVHQEHHGQTLVSGYLMLAVQFP